jgi:multisubunit Na+/H+ antiporter MnhG subunit
MLRVVSLVARIVAGLLMFGGSTWFFIRSIGVWRDPSLYRNWMARGGGTPSSAKQARFIGAWNTVFSGLIALSMGVIGIGLVVAALI